LLLTNLYGITWTKVDESRYNFSKIIMDISYYIAVVTGMNYGEQIREKSQQVFLLYMVPVASKIPIIIL